MSSWLTDRIIRTTITLADRQTDQLPTSQHYIYCQNGSGRFHRNIANSGYHPSSVTLEIWIQC